MRVELRWADRAKCTECGAFTSCGTGLAAWGSGSGSGVRSVTYPSSYNRRSHARVHPQRAQPRRRPASGERARARARWASRSRCCSPRRRSSIACLAGSTTRCSGRSAAPRISTTYSSSTSTRNRCGECRKDGGPVANGPRGLRRRRAVPGGPWGARHRVPSADRRRAPGRRGARGGARPQHRARGRRAAGGVRGGADLSAPTRGDGRTRATRPGPARHGGPTSSAARTRAGRTSSCPPSRSPSAGGPASASST